MFMIFGEIYCYINALHREGMMRVCIDSTVQAWPRRKCSMQGINQTAAKRTGIMATGLAGFVRDWVEGLD
jgi:hypothetical protein